METPVNYTPVDAPKELPSLTPESTNYLLTAAKWGKFLAILGFIMTGLLVAAAIAMVFVFNAMPDDMIPLNLPFPTGFLSLLYLLIAGIYVTPVIFLNNFCNQAIKAIKNSNTENLTFSIRNLKNLFVFIGITTIVILTIYLVVILLAVVLTVVTM